MKICLCKIYFDRKSMCDCFQLGVEKPDPRIFDVLFRNFRLKDPDQLLHIGDDQVKVSYPT